MAEAPKVENSNGQAVPVKEVANLSLESKPANGKPPASPVPPTASEGTSSSPTPESSNLKDQFKAFSKFGDTKSDGKLITLSQSDKWMKQAKVNYSQKILLCSSHFNTIFFQVIDKKITTTDTGIHFKKFKALKISYTDYNKYLEDLAKVKGVDLAEIKKKLTSCGQPGVSQAKVCFRVSLL